MFERRIAIVGPGYVRLTSGACLASLGHRVVCADIDPAKMERLRGGQIDIRDDGLSELVHESVTARRLSFAGGAAAAITDLTGEEQQVEGVSCVSRRPRVSAGAPTSRSSRRPGTCCRRAAWWSTNRRFRSALLGKRPKAVVDDPEAAAKDAEAIVVLTEWPEFRTLDGNRLAELSAVARVVDTRNLLDPDVLRRASFSWTGVGRRVSQASSAR